MLAPLRHGIDFGLAVDARRDSLGRQAFDIDAAPVVADRQRDPVARLACGEFQQTDLALVGLDAFARPFEPVVDRVADDVRQRIADHFDHFAVELHFAAFEIDHNLLAKLVREIADQPWERAEQMFKPLHAHAGDCIANIGEDRAEPIEGAVDRRLLARLAQAAR